MDSPTLAQASLPKPPPSANEDYQGFMNGIRQMHSIVDVNFTKMNELKQEFFVIQEKKFVKAFTNVMDRMSDELHQANLAYESIDREIEANPQCQYLTQELNFFKSQCLNLRREITKKKEALEYEKAKKKRLAAQKGELQTKLYNETTRELKYKSKTKSLISRKMSFAEKKSQISREKNLFDHLREEKSQQEGRKVKISQNLYARRRNYSQGNSLRESASFVRTGNEAAQKQLTNPVSRQKGRTQSYFRSFKE